MKFEIKELKDKKKEYAVINADENCLDNIKKNIKNIKAVEIDFDYLNLGTKLYGDNKKASKLIQKENCNHMLKVLKVCKKVVKLFKKSKVEFDGVFYVKNLSNKKNNNDFMLISMLDTDLNYNMFKRLGMSVHYACDYLDMENAINNMCDFQDNKCVNHRVNNIKKTTGCCPSFCKYTECKVCTVKNLSCKIFMCDYLEDRGYYFTPHTIPILKRHLNIFERFMCFGILFRTTKKTIKRLWLIRCLLIAYAVVIAAGIVLPIIF